MPSSTGRRVELERVVVARKGDDSWVKVALRWPEGHMTEGTGAAGSTSESRARGASLALVEALKPLLTSLQAKLEVDHLVLHQIGSSESILLRAVFYEKGAVTPLVGSALVYDDVATAAVRAVFQAINRKLRLS